MSQTTQEIDQILRKSSYTFWVNTHQEGATVQILVNGTGQNSSPALYKFYERKSGEFVFLRLAAT
jgi:hypothetical protein